MSEKVESKKYTIPKIREIIYAFKNQCLTSSHPSFGIFKDLLMNHPTWKTRIDDIRAIKIVVNRMNQHLLMKIKPHWSPKFILVSWKKCHVSTRKLPAPPLDTHHPTVSNSNPNPDLNPIPNPVSIPPPILESGDETVIKNNTKNLLTGAMRSSIRRQILHFRKTSLQSMDHQCAQCTSVEKLQVDHIVPFSKLQEEFLGSTSLTLPTKFNYNHRTGQPKFTKNDHLFKKNWQQYHLKKASYQWLCAVCNRRKSNNI